MRWLNSDFYRDFPPTLGPGLYKVPISKQGGGLSSLLGKNIKLWRGVGNIMAELTVEKNKLWEKGKQHFILSDKSCFVEYHEGNEARKLLENKIKI